MKNPVLRLVDAETGVGIEAPMSSVTSLELAEAAMALLNAARIKGWVTKPPPPPDPMTIVFDYQDRR